MTALRHRAHGPAWVVAYAASRGPWLPGEPGACTLAVLAVGYGLGHRWNQS